MGVVTRRDSPFFWLHLERAGQPAIREATKLRWKGLAEYQRKENQRLAEQVYHTRMADLARQTAGLPVQRDRATFRYFAAWYLKHLTPTKRGAEREASMIRRLVKHFGNKTLDTIDASAAREYLTTRTQVVSPSTANRELDVLKAMLVAAVPKYLAVSPLAGVKRLHVRVPQPRILTHVQELALLKVMTPPDQALLIAALDTLLRQGDLVDLKWAQDHGDHLEVVDPKNGHPYTVPVSQRLRMALDGLERQGPYVFRHVRKGRRAANVINRMFRTACALAKVQCGRPDGVTWHGLRHTGATRALAAGASIRDVMALGGWRDMKSMQRYLRPTGVDRALVDRMSRTG